MRSRMQRLAMRQADLETKEDLEARTTLDDYRRPMADEYHEFDLSEVNAERYEAGRPAPLDKIFR